ncbi:MAG TPA: M15 family metallopeptidase [Longimicrobiales bacterium]|nr:M15 family metallopeptidase [Longimicrobiales bacterium]
MTPYARGLAVASGLALGLGTVAAFAAAPSQEAGPRAPVQAPATPRQEDPQQGDPRARAFLEAYGELIDSVSHTHGDLVFHIGEHRIAFRDGRMLEEGREGEGDGPECDPIFYTYSLEPLRVPLRGPAELPTYCSDLLEAVWGRTEAEIREHGTSATFLGHRMFVNRILVEPLRAVERDLLRAARRDRSVQGWIEELDVTYSFMQRDIAGSGNPSYHAWGLAVDFVPRSYEGKHVYWRWSRVLEGDDWDRIPLEERWSPPERVVEIFERHGFVWGGKWPLFDAMHFEYRPEILAYNRILAEDR